MSGLKRCCLVVVISMLAICIFCYTCVKAAETGTVTAETVKLRKGASTDSDTVMLMDKGDQIEIIGTEGDWYKVNFEGKSGYVSKQYVKTNSDQNSATNTTNSVTNTTTTNEQNTSNHETTNTQNESTNEKKDQNTEAQNIPSPEIGSEKQITKETGVFIHPVITSSQMEKINNQKIKIEKVMNQWSYVSYGNHYGWIKNIDLVDSEEAKQEEQKQEESKETPLSKTSYVNVESAYIRQKPDKNSDIVKSVIKNTKLQVSAEENGWYKVVTDGASGYISKELVTDKPEETSRALEQPRTENPVEQQEVASVNEVNQTGAEVVSTAKQYLGCDYVLGGTGPSQFDCSGFTSYIYKKFGYQLSRTATGQASNGRAVSRGELQQGDLVIFNDSANSSIGHVGIYVGGNQFIHAASPGKGVIITSMSMSYYNTRYVTARRIL